jgi:predicted nucleic acid-binding protein
MDKIIISDTSCLIALSKINQLEILRNLYSQIIITKEVFTEYCSPLPDWIMIFEVKNTQKRAELEERLDKGEASSIALALEIENSTLIIDEIKGRKIAQSLNIDIIGTIGVILLAEKKGLIKDVLEVLFRLVNKGFRLSDKLIDSIINKYRRE